MKPIITTTFLASAGNAGTSDPDHIADDEARRRREAERARLRRLHSDRHQHAEAERRLAETMARASVRTKMAQLTQLGQPMQPVPDLLSMPRAPKVDTVKAAPTDDKQGDAEEAPAEITVHDARAAVNELADPIAALFQRLARGQSSRLLQDCEPMLDAIATQLSDQMSSAIGDRPEDRESLASALDFLRGYADAAMARVPGAAQLAHRLDMLRQQLAFGIPAANGQQCAEQGRSCGLAPGSTGEREHVKPAQKARVGSNRGPNAELDDEDSLSPAALAGVAGDKAVVQGNVASATDASLDKDQRKRRDDTLPLVTLRSI